jgi:hypothetical protein
VGKGDLTKIRQLPSRERDLQLFKYKWVEIHIENVIAQGNVIPKLDSLRKMGLSSSCETKNLSLFALGTWTHFL